MVFLLKLQFGWSIFQRGDQVIQVLLSNIDKEGLILEPEIARDSSVSNLKPLRALYSFASGELLPIVDLDEFEVRNRELLGVLVEIDRYGQLPSEQFVSCYLGSELVKLLRGEWSVRRDRERDRFG